MIKYYTTLPLKLWHDFKGKAVLLRRLTACAKGATIFIFETFKTHCVQTVKGFKNKDCCPFWGWVV
jgi:hypothetical protein